MICLEDSLHVAKTMDVSSNPCRQAQPNLPHIVVVGLGITQIGSSTPPLPEVAVEMVNVEIMHLFLHGFNFSSPLNPAIELILFRVTLRILCILCTCI